MIRSKLVHTGVAGALAVGLVATGFAAQAQAPAIDIDDTLNQLHDFEKGAEEFLNTDPNSIDLQAEVAKLTGYQVEGLNAFFKSEEHLGLMLNVSGKKKSEIKVTDRKNGEVVQRGRVGSKPKLFDIPTGKYKVSAKRGKKSAKQNFKTTERYGANVHLHLKKK